MPKRKKVEDKVDAVETPLAHNPFAALAPAVAAPSTPKPPPASENADAKGKPWGTKLVLSREKKGRGGKTVTRLRGLPKERLEEVARRMKKSLGCGASVEGEDVLLHGAGRRVVKKARRHPRDHRKLTRSS